MNLLATLRNRLAWSIRTVLSGSGSRKFAPTPGAPTLLPVGGAAWLVHAEASMMVGGIRALLLQSLHPVAMQGVGEHSDFRADPLGRLRRTVFFLGTTTYCALPEAEAAIEAVRRVHLSVSGVTPDGRDYRADDPDLLAWVHATEVDSFLEAFLRFGRPRRRRRMLAPNLPERTAVAAAVGPIPMADLADRYVAEMATVAERLGITEPPRSRAELAAVIDGFGPVVAATDLSTEAVYFLRRFPLPPLARLAYAVLFWAAAGSLPRWAQELHGLRCGPLRRGLARPAARAMLGVMGWALRNAPDPEESPQQPPVT
ncbi:MAG: oxygenase MpaB family protein [bacterium]|nr:oxygenase MpaB family protein [bacterium]